MKNSSYQNCRGHDVDRHKSVLNLQARRNQNRFFYTQQTDTRTLYAGNGISLELSYQCVLRGPWEWRTERWGTVYLHNDIPDYLPVIRTRPPVEGCH